MRLLEDGRDAEAEAPLGECLEIRQEALGEGHCLPWTPGPDIMNVMRADDLTKALSPEGFSPFVLNLSNGESYPITHPEQILVDRSTAIFGTTRIDGGRRYEKLVICTLMHIVSLVPIEETEVKIGQMLKPAAPVTRTRR